MMACICRCSEVETSGYPDSPKPISAHNQRSTTGRIRDRPGVSAGAEKKRHVPRYQITHENRYLLVDPRNQPRLVLRNGDYSNILTEKQKLTLSRAENPECQRAISSKKTGPKIDEDEPTEIGAKRREREEETTVDEPRKRIKMTTVILTSAQKIMIGQRCEDTIGTNANESAGVFSVLENDGSSIQTTNVGSDESSIHQNVKIITSATTVDQGSKLPINGNFDQSLRPLTSFQKCLCPNFGKDIFLRHCFSKLKTGICNAKACGFAHELLPNLKNLGKARVQRINRVISAAIDRRFNYFIGQIYPTILNRADYVTRVRLFHKLMEVDLMSDLLVEKTFSLLDDNGLPVIKFLKDAAAMVNEKNETLGIDQFWRLFRSVVPLGSYWTVLRDLLIRETPTILSAGILIHECCINANFVRDKSHIEDIYINYMKKLAPEQFAKIYTPLRNRFEYLLVEHNIIDRSPGPKNLTDTADVRTNRSKAAVFSPPTISSPDNPQCNPCLSFSPESPESPQCNPNCLTFSPESPESPQCNPCLTFSPESA